MSFLPHEHVPGVGQQVIKVNGTKLWDYDAKWYRAMRTTDDCMDPTDFRRVNGCHCRLCQSKLTDSKLTGQPA